MSLDLRWMRVVSVSPVVSAVGSSVGLCSNVGSSGLLRRRKGRLGSIDSYHLVCSGSVRDIGWWAHLFLYVSLV